MVNRFGHIDLRVPDLERAMPFYEAFLPHLGFTRPYHNPVWKTFAGEGDLPQAPYISLTADPDHRPNANRIAFWAASREEVDAAAEVVKTAGARDVDGPAEVPPFGATYYAVYFEDPFGNRFEFYYRVNPA